MIVQGNIHDCESAGASMKIEARNPMAGPIVPELLVGLAVTLLGALAMMAGLAVSPGLVGSALGVYLAMAAVIATTWPTHYRSFGWPNRITLLRGALVAVLAGALLVPELYRQHGLPMAGLSLVVLALDGLDGWLARSLGASSAFGARFDMEVDSLLVLVLAIAVFVSGTTGPWVLAIGLMRYVFAGLGLVVPWLRAELPDSARRKWICVIQVLALVVAVAFPVSTEPPPIDPFVVRIMLGTALMLLIGSFARDVAWLAARRRSKTAGATVR